MAARRVVACLALAGIAHAFLDDALDIIKFSKDIGEEVLESWDVIGRPFNATGGVELPIVRRRERVVLARLANVERAIERVELMVERASAAAELLAKRGGGGVGARLELRLHELADLLGRVGSADRQLREYVRLQHQLERSTLMDFAEWCVTHEPLALPGLLERVHALVAPPERPLLSRGLLQLLVDDLQEEHPDLCELQMSPHQMVYDMYNTVALTEIKGYAMMQFSWMLLRIYGKGNFTQEASLTRQRYAERTARTATAARTALAMAPRTLHRCDPPRHEEGVTYAQVTRLLQGYVENEVDMNADGSCKENCAYYTLAQNHGCYDDKYCTKREPCRGRLLECQYIDSDMWVCPASGQSSRRYEWIRYENERTLGRVGSCARGTTKVDSWWRWVFWHCSYCMCLCDEEGPRSDRYFSLRDAAADVANNKVVTGVRLVKLGRVFHLQVSEGELGERGRVTPGSWVPLQKFDPLDMAVQEGRDYHTLTYEKRAVDLDQLDSPEGHVLTGIRFRMHGPHLHFEIRSTPFNYTSGRLYHEKSQWVSNDNTDGAEKPRTRLSLISPDIPTRRASPLPIDSQHDQYVEFTHSDLEADAAQSTVPFLDIQPLRPLGGAALASGAGLAHRGARGSGGYLTLQLLTYDYSRHVRAEAPPTDFGDEDTTDFVPIVN